jgi:plastocyanin
MKYLFLSSVMMLGLAGAGCAAQPSVLPQPAAPEVAPPVQKLPVQQPPPLQPNAPTKVKPGPVTQTVIMKNLAFSPQTMAINAGDSIVWVNQDTVNHTSASDGALIWDSGNIAPGASYKRTFTAPGTYNYHCGIHPSMKGTIVVH